MRVEPRYARAFLESASLEEVNELLEVSQPLLKGKTLFYLSQPTFTLQKKYEFLKGYLPPMSEKVERFLYLLLRKRRIFSLPGILEEIQRMVREKEGISEAYVRSAIPLTPVEKERLIKALEKRTGRKIVLKEEVDPSILGGLVVEVEGDMLDYSLKGFLSRLHEHLSKEVVARWA
ncbi:ATP synthase F1 subunit delta [bacterium]|nr:ATP synthase F1 subunit delta [bacterium]